MAATSGTMHNRANLNSDRTCTSLTGNGCVNSLIVNKIREIYNSKTAETLAAWLKISIRTAKHRLANDREFTLDEVAELLHSEHGFEILSALMTKAPRAPMWWRLCVPLMDLADAERMVAVVRKRTEAAIQNRDEVTDALEIQIRRAQTLAIHGSEQAGVHADALRSLTRQGNSLVAAGRRRK